MLDLLSGSIAGVTSPFIHRMGKQPKVEAARRASTDLASEIFSSSISDGVVFPFLTMGDFSMLDVVAAVLDQTGPANVDISTWTMGVYDANALWSFVESAKIERIRFLMDPSMFGRREDLAKEFIAAFGGDSIRCIESHAKFTLIYNDNYSVLIQSSMNMNRNKRLENGTVICDAGAVGFHRDIVDQVFASAEPGFSGKRMGRMEFAALAGVATADQEVW